MKKNSFLVNVLIISFTSLFLNSVSIAFKVYLSSQIGEAGMGLYQLILSVYIFAATIATSGLSFTVTRLVSEAIATGNSSKIRKTMICCFTFALSLGFIAFFGLFFSSNYIGTILLANPETVPCLKILSIGLPFMSISSCLSGFFLGLRKVAFSSAVQIFEEFMQIVICLILLNIFAPQGAEASCIAVVIGIASSELLACLCAFLLFILQKKNFKKGKENSKFIFKKILSITLPVSFSSYLRSALVTLENLMISTSLQKSGLSKTEALSVFGLLKGMVIPILFFPAVFLNAFSRLLMPEIADARATGNYKKIDEIGSTVISATLIFSIMVSAVFIFYSNPLGILIYSSEKAGKMFLILAPLIPFMYLDGIIDSMLKGIDEQVAVMKYSLIEAIIRVLMVWFLIPASGVEGFIVTLYAGNVINSALSLMRFIKKSNLKFPFISKVFRISIIAAISCFPFSFFTRYLAQGSKLSILLIVLSVIVYIFLIFSGNIFKKQDIIVLKTLFLGQKKDVINDKIEEKEVSLV